jgi:hypothetical protein
MPNSPKRRIRNHFDVEMLLRFESCHLIVSLRENGGQTMLSVAAGQPRLQFAIERRSYLAVCAASARRLAYRF